MGVAAESPITVSNQSVTILDYGAGNLTSVRLACERFGVAPVMATCAEEALPAGSIIFPGDGSAGSAMEQVRSRGYDRLLEKAVADGRPVLGICIGMQLLFDWSDEDGGVPALGLLPGRVRRFDFPNHPELKIPEMGWNAVHFDETHPLFRGIPQDTPFYFVHSYYCAPDSSPLVLGTTEYGGMEFCSAAIRGSLAATQFHPERSGEFGLRLFRNFLEWDGKGGTAGC